MFNDLDIDVDVEEDPLPPNLSHQLGQLILGAAHHFNADNPNIDVNFFANVFGGDEDFGMNPGDEDMYLFDSDSDSYMDDTDDNIQQVFTSLSDSHVIRRLSFHKNVENVYSFPRVTISSEHCYEEIYRLLEELELLCKIWRRRVEHPYTAHIAPQLPPPLPSSESCLREGEDYSSSDYEYDSDEDDYERLPQGGVNETLTKKKFCQSAKTFHQFFTSLQQFETFQRQVSKMKKYIFNIIFQLFLDALPTNTRLSIPQELWEKIWKFTQNSYFRFKSSVPLSQDTTYYKAGLRSATRTMISLEKERLKDLFGALGDIHMLLFEILFKNPHILQPSPLFELEVEGGGENHSKNVWKCARQGVRTAFIRLQHVDQLLTDQMETEGVVVPETFIDIATQLDSGCVVTEDAHLDLSECPYKLDPSASCIVSSSICRIICLLGRYSLEGGFGLVMVLVDVDTGKIVQTVETEHNYQSHLIDVGSHHVRRKGGQGWKKHFCLTEDRITLLARVVDKDNDTLKVWSYPIFGGGNVVRSVPPLVDVVAASATPNSQFRHSTEVDVAHTNNSIVVIHQSPYEVLSNLMVYSTVNGELLLSLHWQEDITLLSIMNSRALLRSSTRSSLLLFSLQSGEIVYTWRQADLNTELALPVSTVWSAVFDSDPEINQLLLFTHSMSSYRLLEFSPDNELARPRNLLSGSMVEGVDGLGPIVVLSKGVLFTNTKRELVCTKGGEAPLRAHEVAGYSLANRSKHILACMGSDRKLDEMAVLNKLSRVWWDEPSVKSGEIWDPERRPVFMTSKNKLVVLLEEGNTVRMFDMGQTSKVVAEKQANQLDSIFISES